jgi:3-oxoacyl-[acyl-carrier protein] reductase
MNQEFADKVAVVTGGSRGIGRAIVLAFVQRGAQVFFNHFDAEGNEAALTESLAQSLGGNATGFKVDVSDAKAVKAFFDSMLGQAGRIDFLVNNAGITRDNFLARMKEADWDCVLDTNLKGAFLCLQEASRTFMKQRSGAVVNIASVVGAMGNAGQTNYSAAKAGLMGLTRSAAKELASRGIRLNAVAPGFIDTDMTKVLPEKIREQFIAATPAGRMGTPEEVAAAVVFLCSESASFITGQVLHVNGGLFCG